MSFVAIMKATPDGRLAKYQGFPTQAGADAHVARFTDRYPDAFVIPEPAAPFPHWRIDMAAETLVIDPPPPLPLPTESADRLALRDIAAEIDKLGGGAVALIDARFGPKLL